jgi:hypothetical protein
MASSGIKAARVQSKSSSLNVFWAASTLQTPRVLSAVKHATAWLNRSRGISTRPAGRHAAPARNRAVNKHRAVRR